MYALTWLPTVLKAAGLTVITSPGWANRGHGNVGPIKGVLCHHTAGPKAGNAPSLGVVVNGRKDLSGPLAQLYLARDGVFTVVAAGLAYHAGAGYWQGVTTGNSSFIGIEAENTGLANDRPWPEVQMDAYRRGVAAILTKIKADPIMAAGHSEYALPKGRKSDPSFNMNDFRLAVADIMDDAGAPPAKPDPVEPSGVRVRVVRVAPDTLAFRKTPGGEQTGELPQGTVVVRVGTDGSWSNVVTPKGFKGWVASRFLAPA